ncbi:MAG TPA: hypothetical protein VFN91_10990 [Myxococcaceae bacterium]|nr:hypothetical protein [Myxococcaceae bacterium]
MLRKAALFGLSLLVLSGCKKEEPPPPPPPPVAPAPPPPPPPAPFRVTAAQLGKGIQPDNTVQMVTATFGPKDTIYLSVTSMGMTQATLATRWTFGPKDVLVHEESKSVSPTSERPMRTEFHISKPSGWPAGDYKVVLTVDGQPSQTQTFAVSKSAARR